MSIAIISFFVIFAFSLFAIAAALKYFETQNQKRVQQVIRSVDAPSGEVKRELRLDLGRVREPGGVDQALGSFQFYERLDLLLQQSGLDWTPGRMLSLCFLFAVVGALFGFVTKLLIFPLLSALAFGSAFATLPYLYVRRRRTKRLREFEADFPEALDFVSRSMRAGHAFSISLGMLADETPGPVGQEFRKTYNEHSLGASLEAALASLKQRVPLLDVRFFTSAVLLQREVGGNLSEILQALAYVIRERFRLKGHVRAVSAHGRLTAMILVVLPILTLLALLVVAPSYIQKLIEDPHGKWLIAYAIVSQLIGFVIIRKIVDIKI